MPLTRRITLLALVPLTLAMNPAWGKTQAPACPRQIDVRNLMTVSEFQKTGLDRLTQAQLTAFNAWLNHYAQNLCTGLLLRGPSPAPTGMHAPSTKSAATGVAPTFGKPQNPLQSPNRIESRIVGEFHGWNGGTTFHLANGQTWKQAGPGYFRINLKKPKVLIKKLLFGYVLLVEGYGKEVFVRRIR